jgi:lipopolysaccharide biosynthesis regulator YciM
MGQNKASSEVMKVEYVKLLIDLEKKDEAIVQVKGLLENIHQTLTKHYCSQCGFNSDNLFWRCPQCHEWETIQFRWKV